MTFLGQSDQGPNPVDLLEFWNRSLTKVWALDGTAPGQARPRRPTSRAPDGTLTNPDTDYVLVTPGVDIAGQSLGDADGGYTLFRLDGRLQLRTAQTGVYPDGWMGPLAELHPVRRPARRHTGACAYDSQARPGAARTIRSDRR